VEACVGEVRIVGGGAKLVGGGVRFEQGCFPLVVLHFCLWVWVRSGEADDDYSVGSIQSAHVQPKESQRGASETWSSEADCCCECECVMHHLCLGICREQRGEV